MLRPKEASLHPYSNFSDLARSRPKNRITIEADPETVEIDAMDPARTAAKAADLEVVKVAAAVDVGAVEIAANPLHPRTTANFQTLPAWMFFASLEMGH